MAGQDKAIWSEMREHEAAQRLERQREAQWLQEEFHRLTAEKRWLDEREAKLKSIVTDSPQRRAQLEEYIRHIADYEKRMAVYIQRNEAFVRATTRAAQTKGADTPPR